MNSAAGGASWAPYAGPYRDSRWWDVLSRPCARWCWTGAGTWFWPLSDTGAGRGDLLALAASRPALLIPGFWLVCALVLPAQPRTCCLPAQGCGLLLGLQITESRNVRG